MISAAIPRSSFVRQRDAVGGSVEANLAWPYRLGGWHLVAVPADAGWPARRQGQSNGPTLNGRQCPVESYPVSCVSPVPPVPR
jgi:hypothetical protein